MNEILRELYLQFGYFSFLIMNCTHKINSLDSSKTSLECVKYNEWLWLLITRAGRKHSWARNAQDKCFWKMRQKANWMSLECAIMVPEGLWYYNWITSTPHLCPTPMTKHTFNFPKQFQSVSGEILEIFFCCTIMIRVYLFKKSIIVLFNLCKHVIYTLNRCNTVEIL